MILGTLSQPQNQAPHLFLGLTWHEFKAVEKLLDRPALVKQASTIPTTKVASTRSRRVITKAGNAAVKSIFAPQFFLNLRVLIFIF